MVLIVNINIFKRCFSLLAIWFVNCTAGFTFGFENAEYYIDDRPGAIDINLPLAINANSATEIPMTLRFTTGTGTTTQEDEGMYSLSLVWYLLVNV